jgi:hypothetical protein
MCRINNRTDDNVFTTAVEISPTSPPVRRIHYCFRAAAYRVCSPCKPETLRRLPKHFKSVRRNVAVTYVVFN